jgi:hypothetical protein
MPTPEAGLSIAFQLIGAETVKNKNNEVIRSLNDVGNSWRKTNEQMSRARSYLGAFGGMAAIQGLMGGGSSYSAQSNLGSAAQYAGQFGTYMFSDYLITNSQNIMNLAVQKMMDVYDNINSSLYKVKKSYANLRLRTFKENFEILKTRAAVAFSSSRIGRFFTEGFNAQRMYGKYSESLSSRKPFTTASSLRRDINSMRMMFTFVKAAAESAVSNLTSLIPKIRLPSIATISSGVTAVKGAFISGGLAIGSSIKSIFKFGIKGIGAALGSFLGPIGTVAGLIITSIIAEKVGEWLGKAADWVSEKVIIPVWNYSKAAFVSTKNWIARNITGNVWAVSTQFDPNRLNQFSMENLRDEILTLRTEIPRMMKREGYSPDQIRNQLLRLQRAVDAIENKVDFQVRNIYETFEFVSRR